MKTTFLDVNPEGLSSLQSCSPCVLTIGNFDGLHLGHQEMLSHTIDIAHQETLASAVMVFEPMPKEFFSPDTAPERLMNLHECQFYFGNYESNGKTIDELIIARFDDKFRSLSAEEFANILKNRLNVKQIVMGDDFCFGYDRTGDSKFLREYGLSVTSLSTIKDSKVEKRISSTRVRDLLGLGAVNKANELLGRDYCMIGEVIHGDKIGRTLNFPTANVELNRLKPALHGVFAVDVQILDDNNQVIEDVWANISSNYETDVTDSKSNNGIEGLMKHSLFGTANVGTRPAVGGVEWRLEVHFPNFNGDLYGKLLKVRFLHYLHGEKKYNGLEELKRGIKSDVKALIEWRLNQN